MLKDLFYKLFKDSKVEYLDRKVFEMQKDISRVVQISVSNKERAQDLYEQILELEKRVEELSRNLKAVHDYVKAEKWGIDSKSN